MKIQKVLKFGGTSMGSVESLEKIHEIIQKNIQENIDQVVVCSAMSQVTNKLIKIGELAENSEIKEALALFEIIQKNHDKTAKKLKIKEAFKTSSSALFSDLKNFILGIGMIHELSDRSHAYLVSFGEKLSTRLLNCFLVSKKINSVQLDAKFFEMKGENYLEADIDWEKTKKSVQKIIPKYFENKQIPIVTGFFGYDKEGIISLLGRGGSDFSGAIMAVSLKIKILEIWTDVDGFLSADPRMVKEAKHIKDLGFYEAAELCFFGAKVLHPSTIRPVIDIGGEVWIKNTFNLKKQGTRITESVKGDCHPFASVTTKEVLLLSLDIFGSKLKKSKIFSELFNLAEVHKISIDAMASSESMISFCIESKYENNLDFFRKIKKIAPLEIKKNRTIVCLVSPENVRGRPGVAAELFSTLQKSKISVEMYSQNASELVQLVVVKSEFAKDSVKAIHRQTMEESCFLGLEN